MKNKYYFHGFKTVETPKGVMKRRVSIAALQQDNKLIIGVAQCSDKDQFKKELGRTISEGRALKKPTETIEFIDMPGKTFHAWCQEYCK